MPTNQPLLPDGLYPTSTSEQPQLSSRLSSDSSRALPTAGPSSEPQYGEPSGSTSSMPSSPTKRPLLGLVRSSFTRRQGKEVALLDHDDDQQDRLPRRARSPGKHNPEGVHPLSDHRLTSSNLTVKGSVHSTTPRHPRPPSLDLSTAAFVDPSSRKSPVPSQISLPPESPSEALHETEVIELQAFVDKKLWIEDRIAVSPGLPLDLEALTRR